ncbi:Glycosyl hydrolase family 14 [Nocardioides scoriae]|uniref:Beta-amylase n=1 Tax=Nocardioides scoriae TaxID=642780 RepID=A0A1H1PUD2_9ACTN|nr:family 14 glycosylhydrolase [Nocardioides scoriae]SDS14736.1 Glycosyl hydrolase family 14 [Nocardioides scoriae]
MRLTHLSRTVPRLLVGLTAAALTSPLLAAPATAADGPRPPGNLAQGNPDFTANVMAPLKVTNWADFRHDLEVVDGYGVDAVSVDVWWGDVEKAGDNRFDWSYYDRVFAEVTRAGLDLAPILSFHQCGGNVGDDYTSLLPSWLWKKYAGRSYRGIKLGQHGLQHRSEQGNWSKETVAGWADGVVAGEYRDFTKAFTRHFEGRYGRDVSEINVSLGPSGELRYPSYNSHDTGSGYPTRGALQSYSPLAQQSFRRWTLAKYDTLRKVNRAWGTSYRSRAQVASPRDADAFFEDGTYASTRYGRDYVDWYNGSLVSHGKRMLTTVSKALGSGFRYADLGYKVPGIHWQMGQGSPYPRATEVTTGLIQTSVDEQAWSTGHGYAKIIELAGRIPTRRDVEMHFTALEMDDNNPGEPFNGGLRPYSLAKTLVGWIGDYAARVDTDLKGENALNGGLYSEQGWANIQDAFDQWGYLGLTVLRMQDVSRDADEIADTPYDPPLKWYAAFIDRQRT